MSKIEIYIKPTCPFCTRAKMLLDKKGVSYEVIDVSRSPAMQESMRVRAEGRRTVPQIFINDMGIGGCDDLHSLEATGKLDVLLAG